MTTAAVKKRKRIVLVCRLVKQGKTLANVFNIGKSTDHDKIKNEGKLLTEVQDGVSIKKRRIVRRSDYDELDKPCFFDLSQRCKGKNCLAIVAN